jgi:hypothetical protein
MVIGKNPKEVNPAKKEHQKKKKREVLKEEAPERAG